MQRAAGDRKHWIGGRAGAALNWRRPPTEGTNWHPIKTRHGTNLLPVAAKDKFLAGRNKSWDMRAATNRLTTGGKRRVCNKPAGPHNGPKGPVMVTKVRQASRF